MPLHICPVCHRPHVISAVHQAFAYGHQLTCSASCKLEQRHRVLAQAHTQNAAPLSLSQKSKKAEQGSAFYI